MGIQRLSVAKDFSETPGPRYKSEGEFSGELFRETVLKKAVERAITEGVQLEVNLDGTEGYATSFLEESFGGLIRSDGMDYEKLRMTIVIVSDEEDYLKQDVEAYMAEAWKAKS